MKPLFLESKSAKFRLFWSTSDRSVVGSVCFIAKFSLLSAFRSTIFPLKILEGPYPKSGHLRWRHFRVL